jgi:glutamate-ammonia-ligase adenylyltransferase
MRRAVVAMKNNILAERGPSISWDEVLRMRHRIEQERSKDDLAAGIFDIKLGSGGINEIEFLVQYLQLRNCKMHPAVLVQNTVDAIRRLGQCGIIDAASASKLRDAYLFLRIVETMLRLRNETVLRNGSGADVRIARLMQITTEQFSELLAEKRAWVCTFKDTLS